MSLPQIPVASHWLNRFLGAVPKRSSLVEGTELGATFALSCRVSFVLIRKCFSRKVSCVLWKIDVELLQPAESAPRNYQTMIDSRKPPLFQTGFPTVYPITSFLQTVQCFDPATKHTTLKVNYINIFNRLTLFMGT